MRVTTSANKALSILRVIRNICVVCTENCWTPFGLVSHSKLESLHQSISISLSTSTKKYFHYFSQYTAFRYLILVIDNSYYRLFIILAYDMKKSSFTYKLTIENTVKYADTILMLMWLEPVISSILGK